MASSLRPQCTPGDKPTLLSGPSGHTSGRLTYTGASHTCAPLHLTCAAVSCVHQSIHPRINFQLVQGHGTGERSRFKLGLKLSISAIFKHSLMHCIALHCHCDGPNADPVCHAVDLFLVNNSVRVCECMCVRACVRVCMHTYVCVCVCKRYLKHGWYTWYLTVLLQCKEYSSTGTSPCTFPSMSSSDAPLHHSLLFTESSLGLKFITHRGDGTQMR